MSRGRRSGPHPRNPRRDWDMEIREMNHSLWEERADQLLRTRLAEEALRQALEEEDEGETTAPC
ncbi:MAG: hypothetical protein Kow0092_24780 [Deferrisomatales bacterium]